MGNWIRTLDRLDTVNIIWNQRQLFFYFKVVFYNYKVIIVLLSFLCHFLKVGKDRKFVFYIFRKVEALLDLRQRS